MQTNLINAEVEIQRENQDYTRKVIIVEAYLTEVIKSSGVSVTKYIGHENNRKSRGPNKAIHFYPDEIVKIHSTR